MFGYVLERQDSVFNLPLATNLGELSGFSTTHVYTVDTAPGVKRYELEVVTLRAKLGKLGFKVEYNGNVLNARQKNVGGVTSQDNFCHRHVNYKLRFIFSRGLGSKGIKDKLRMTGSTQSDDSEPTEFDIPRPAFPGAG